MSKEYQAPSDAEHPITPPPELVRQWLEDSPEDDELGIADYIATQAARWGGDQELEACCEWFQELYKSGDVLRAARRRPKPPSLKALALEVLAELGEGFQPDLADIDVLRQALESLPD